MPLPAQRSVQQLNPKNCVSARRPRPRNATLETQGNQLKKKRWRWQTHCKPTPGVRHLFVGVVGGIHGAKSWAKNEDEMTQIHALAPEANMSREIRRKGSAALTTAHLAITCRNLNLQSTIHGRK